MKTLAYLFREADSFEFFAALLIIVIALFAFMVW